jgi:hypothetical protein
LICKLNQPDISSHNLLLLSCFVSERLLQIPIRAKDQKTGDRMEVKSIRATATYLTGSVS